MTTLRVIGNSLCPYSADFIISVHVVFVINTGLSNVRKYINKRQWFYIYDLSQKCYASYYRDFQLCITWTVEIQYSKSSIDLT
jgi:hypothetical protein